MQKQETKEHEIANTRNCGKDQAKYDNIEIRLENEIDRTNQGKQLNQKIVLGFFSFLFPKDEGEIQEL